MPMDFLRRIEKEQLPLTVIDPLDIRNVAVLTAAGLVEAILPQESEAFDLPGVVLRITPSGRAELQRIRDKSA
ncbi:hypothetical protein GmRootV118_28060 [Variovorax sp. V118]|uniref:hypothetical protein n=1 Tax=Variovorax sp. V118 TaxID=3065954 RepID=UPI0034E83E26